jgi:type I restriction enzyme S subunit
MEWPKYRLSDVTTILSGGTPKSGVTDYWGNDIRWITPKDMGRMSSEYISDTGRRISKLGLDKSSAKLIHKNSVILSTRAPIGHLAINTEPMATNQGCRGLIPKESLNTKYLYYFLLGNVTLLNELGTGTTFKELSKTALERVEIPLPSIPEQQRIVVILDQAFADIEKARANAEQNLKNARELFDSYLNQVFSQRGDGWVDKPLGDTCTFSSGGTPSKKNSSYWTGNIPWVSGRDMKSTQLSDSLLHISQSAVIESSTRMAPAGSLLILVRGMGLAHGAQVAELTVPCTYNQDIKGIHPDSKLVSRYLVFALRFKINYSDSILSSAAHGTLKIDMAELKNVIIPVPPTTQQRTIVNRINSLITEVNNLETIYKRKLKALDELKKSILQKAFSGELTKSKGIAA